MKKILCQVEYNGRNFAGWQIQNRTNKSVRTVQGEIEKALEKLLKEKVNTFVSGRTDGMVSAKSQYFHFQTNSSFAPKKLAFALFSFLPKDISVKSCKYVSEDFDSRYSVKEKEYHYMCYISNLPQPLIDDFALRVSSKFDVKKAKKAMKCFLGQHDFSAFYKKEDSANYSVEIFNEKKVELLKRKDLTKTQKREELLILQRKHTATRKITFFKLKKKGDLLTFKIRGNGFLHNMARIIIGSVIEIAEGKKTIEQIKKLLNGGAREQAGKTVDAKALVLWDVYY